MSECKVLTGVTAYVCCKSDEAAQRVLTAQLKALGAKVQDRLSKATTHVVFQRSRMDASVKDKLACKAELASIYERVLKLEPPPVVVDPTWVKHAAEQSKQVPERLHIVRRPAQPYFPEPPIAKAGGGSGSKRPRRKSTAVLPRDPSTYDVNTADAQFSSSQQIQDLDPEGAATATHSHLPPAAKRRRHTIAQSRTAAPPWSHSMQPLRHALGAAPLRNSTIATDDVTKNTEPPISNPVDPQEGNKLQGLQQQKHTGAEAAVCTKPPLCFDLSSSPCLAKAAKHVKHARPTAADQDLGDESSDDIIMCSPPLKHRLPTPRKPSRHDSQCSGDNPPVAHPHRSLARVQALQGSSAGMVVVRSSPRRAVHAPNNGSDACGNSLAHGSHSITQPNTTGSVPTQSGSQLAAVHGCNLSPAAGSTAPNQAPAVAGSKQRAKWQMRPAAAQPADLAGSMDGGSLAGRLASRRSVAWAHGLTPLKASAPASLAAEPAPSDPQAAATAAAAHGADVASLPSQVESSADCKSAPVTVAAKRRRSSAAAAGSRCSSLQPKTPLTATASASARVPLGGGSHAATTPKTITIPKLKTPATAHITVRGCMATAHATALVVAEGTVDKASLQGKAQGDGEACMGMPSSPARLQVVAVHATAQPLPQQAGPTTAAPISLRRSARKAACYLTMAEPISAVKAAALTALTSFSQQKPSTISETATTPHLLHQQQTRFLQEDNIASPPRSAAGTVAHIPCTPQSVRLPGLSTHGRNTPQSILRGGADRPHPAAPIVLMAGGTPLISPAKYTRLQYRRYRAVGVDLATLEPGESFLLQPNGTVVPTPLRVAEAAARAHQCNQADPPGAIISSGNCDAASMEGAEEWEGDAENQDPTTAHHSAHGNTINLTPKCTHACRSLQWLAAAPSPSGNAQAAHAHPVAGPVPIAISSDLHSARPWPAASQQTVIGDVTAAHACVETAHAALVSGVLGPLLPVNVAGSVSPACNTRRQQQLRAVQVMPLLLAPVEEETAEQPVVSSTAAHVRPAGELDRHVVGSKQPQTAVVSSKATAFNSQGIPGTKPPTRRKWELPSTAAAGSMTAPITAVGGATVLLSTTTKADSKHARTACTSKPVQPPPRLITAFFARSAPAAQPDLLAELLPPSPTKPAAAGAHHASSRSAAPAAASSKASEAAMPTAACVGLAGPACGTAAVGGMALEAGAMKKCAAASGGMPLRGKEHPMRAGIKYLSHTSLDPALLPLLHAAIKKLGKARLCPDGYEAGHVTHLLVGAERRTLKVLVAVAGGAHLLDPAWLQASVDAGQWLPETDFVAKVRFSKVAATVRDRLAADDSVASIARPLLGYTITVHCQQASNMGMPGNCASGPSSSSSRSGAGDASMCGGGTILLTRSKANEHKAELEKLILALGGRVVPLKACSICVLVMHGEVERACGNSRAAAGPSVRALHEAINSSASTHASGAHRPSHLAVGTPVVAEEWLLTLAESHMVPDVRMFEVRH